jgi:hypothetical protein
MITSYAKRVQKGWFGALVEAIAIEKVVLDGSGLDLFLRNLLISHVLFFFFVVIKLFLCLRELPTKSFDYLRGAYFDVTQFCFVFNLLGPSCELYRRNSFWIIAVLEGACSYNTGPTISSQWILENSSEFGVAVGYVLGWAGEGWNHVS